MAFNKPINQQLFERKSERGKEMKATTNEQMLNNSVYVHFIVKCVSVFWVESPRNGSLWPPTQSLLCKFCSLQSWCVFSRICRSLMMINVCRSIRLSIHLTIEFFVAPYFPERTMNFLSLEQYFTCTFWCASFCFGFAGEWRFAGFSLAQSSRLKFESLVFGAHVGWDKFRFTRENNWSWLF